jgi:hypothetical protein
MGYSRHRLNYHATKPGRRNSEKIQQYRPLESSLKKTGKEGSGRNC